MRAMAKHTASETMIVKITSVEGESADLTFEGQLVNMPFFVAPDVRQRGSIVRFGPEHVHSIYMLKEMTQ